MSISVNEAKLNEFVGKMVGDIGAAMTGALMIVGDKLGLYRELATGALTSAELARRTGTAERYVCEWLAAQAAAGYVGYDAEHETYVLSPEQAMVFADQSSPVFMPGFAEAIAAMWRDEPKITEAFKTGKGVGWHEHDPCLFRGTERFFRPGYAANLVDNWLPGARRRGREVAAWCRVADVGCGHGASTIIMAKAFPTSRFFGFDYHAPSIERARQAAEEAGVADRIRFEVGAAKSFPGGDYDLVALFDCLHDMGDPVGASRHVRETLTPDGTWLVVEPFAHDHLKDNLNSVGRIFYAASTMICTAASLSQEVGLGLGAQAGESRLRAVVMKGGFLRFRRVAERRSTSCSKRGHGESRSGLRQRRYLAANRVRVPNTTPLLAQSGRAGGARGSQVVEVKQPIFPAIRLSGEVRNRRCRRCECQSGRWALASQRHGEARCVIGRRSRPLAAAPASRQRTVLPRATALSAEARAAPG